MTCSEDGTVRLWDAQTSVQKTVVKPALAKAARTAVTACAYARDGRTIAAGLVDGSLQLWDASGRFGTSAAVGQVRAASASTQSSGSSAPAGGGSCCFQRSAHATKDRRRCL